MITKTLKILKNLVLSFDTEDGLPLKTYQATYGLIEILIDGQKADIFAALIRSTEDKYYFPDTSTANMCWEEIIKH